MIQRDTPDDLLTARIERRD